MLVGSCWLVGCCGGSVVIVGFMEGQLRSCGGYGEEPCKGGEDKGGGGCDT